MVDPQEPLTVESLRTLIADLKMNQSPFKPVTVSRDDVEALPLTRHELTGAIDALFGLPMLKRRDGNYRVMHPDDRRHLGEHQGGQQDCERCWSIWGGREFV